MVSQATGWDNSTKLPMLMVMSEDLGQLAVRNASSEEMRDVAMLQGMRTLRQDGWLKVAQGHTTIEEVLRVVA